MHRKFRDSLSYKIKIMQWILAYMIRNFISAQILMWFTIAMIWVVVTFLKLMFKYPPNNWWKWSSNAILFWDVLNNHRSSPWVQDLYGLFHWHIIFFPILKRVCKNYISQRHVCFFKELKTSLRSHDSAGDHLLAHTTPCLNVRLAFLCPGPGM